jgi:hypothetical protein
MADVSDGVDESTPPPDEPSASFPPNAVVTARNTRWRARLGRLEKALNQRAGSPHFRKYLLAFALVLFVAISVFSFGSLPHGVHFHWWPFLAMVLVTTPLTVLANSAEFRVMGVINGHVIGWLASARLTVIAGAANLLPLPGGIVIRTQALRQRGSSYKHALAANAAAGLAWIGMGCLAIAALFIAGSDTRLVALLLVVAGVAALAGTFAILRSVDRSRSRRLLLQLVVVEAFTVLVSGTRIFLAFRMIGLTASAAQSVALTASQIIAAAVGIFPAGLGLREVLAGGIGSAVHLPLNQSVAATASDRIAAQIGLALLAGTMLIQERRQARSPVTVVAPDAPSKLP